MNQQITQLLEIIKKELNEKLTIKKEYMNDKKQLNSLITKYKNCQYKKNLISYRKNLIFFINLYASKLREIRADKKEIMNVIKSNKPKRNIKKTKKNNVNIENDINKIFIDDVAPIIKKTKTEAYKEHIEKIDNQVQFNIKKQSPNVSIIESEINIISNEKNIPLQQHIINYDININDEIINEISIIKNEISYHSIHDNSYNESEASIVDKIVEIEVLLDEEDNDEIYDNEESYETYMQKNNNKINSNIMLKNLSASYVSDNNSVDENEINNNNSVDENEINNNNTVDENEINNNSVNNSVNNNNEIFYEKKYISEIDYINFVDYVKEYQIPMEYTPKIAEIKKNVIVIENDDDNCITIYNNNMFDDEINNIPIVENNVVNDDDDDDVNDSNFDNSDSNDDYDDNKKSNLSFHEDEDDIIDDLVKSFIITDKIKDVEDNNDLVLINNMVKNFIGNDNIDNDIINNIKNYIDKNILPHCNKDVIENIHNNIFFHYENIFNYHESCYYIFYNILTNSINMSIDDIKKLINFFTNKEISISNNNFYKFLKKFNKSELLYNILVNCLFMNNIQLNTDHFDISNINEIVRQITQHLNTFVNNIYNIYIRNIDNNILNIYIKKICYIINIDKFIENENFIYMLNKNFSEIIFYNFRIENVFLYNIDNKIKINENDYEIDQWLLDRDEPNYESIYEEYERLYKKSCNDYFNLKNKISKNELDKLIKIKNNLKQLYMFYENRFNQNKNLNENRFNNYEIYEIKQEIFYDDNNEY